MLKIPAVKPFELAQMLCPLQVLPPVQQPTWQILQQVTWCKRVTWLTQKQPQGLCSMKKPLTVYMYQYMTTQGRQCTPEG